MIKIKWICWILLPLIVLGTCIGSTMYIYSHGTFPLHVISGDISYLQGIAIENNISLNTKQLQLTLKDGKSSYELIEQDDTFMENSELELYARVVEGSQKGRKKISKHMDELFHSLFSTGVEAIETNVLEEAVFEYRFNDKQPYINGKKQKLTFTIRSNPQWQLIEETYAIDENDTYKNYYLLHNGDYISEILFVDSSGFLKPNSEHYLLTEKNPSIVTPPKLYRFSKKENNVYLEELATLPDDRYIEKMVEVDKKVFVISKGKGTTYYLSLYDETGNLRKERCIEGASYIDFERSFTNNSYLIADAGEEVYVFDCEKGERIETYSRNLSEYENYEDYDNILDRYYTGGLLYTVSTKYRNTERIRIQVEKKDSIVFQGDWMVTEYKDEVQELLDNENYMDNPNFYYSPMYYEAEVKE